MSRDDSWRHMCRTAASKLQFPGSSRSRPVVSQKSEAPRNRPFNRWSYISPALHLQEGAPKTGNENLNVGR